MLRVDWWKRWWWVAVIVMMTVVAVLVTLFYLVVLRQSKQDHYNSRSFTDPLANLLHTAMTRVDLKIETMNISAITNVTMDLAMSHQTTALPFRAVNLGTQYHFYDHLDRKLFEPYTITINDSNEHILKRTILLPDSSAVAEMVKEQLVSEVTFLRVSEHCRTRALGRIFSTTIDKQIELAGLRGLSSVKIKTEALTNSKLFGVNLGVVTNAASQVSLNFGMVNMTLQYQGISFADLWCHLDLRAGLNNVKCHGSTNMDLLSNPAKYSDLKNDIKKDKGIPSMLISRLPSSSNSTIETALQAFNSSVILTNSDMKTILSTFGSLSRGLFYWIGL